MPRAALCWVPVHTALLSLGPSWLKAFPQTGGGHATQPSPWAVRGCPAVPLAPAALGVHLPWERCAELALVSLCLGDPGDTSAGDRDTKSVTDIVSLHRTRKGERVLVQGWVVFCAANNSILRSRG